MRLDTLVRLRWLAVIGQTTAVLVVYIGLDFNFAVWPCLFVIALAAWLNVALRIRLPSMQRLDARRTAWLLAFDIAELAVLLFFTGGLQNPFAFLFLGPVLLAATALPSRITLMLGGFAIACSTLLVFVHAPLPWDSERLELPATYVIGIWLSILLAIAFIGLHAWQMTEDARQLADALAATELVLERQQHLSQLDGLAAAAAHELGTPLATITVIAKELALALPANSEHTDDVRLLNEQAKRCRAILSKLTELSSGEPFDRMRLSTLLEEVVAPHRYFGVAINVSIVPSDVPEPLAGRNPAILYGLGNIVENAVEFAQEQVEVTARWSTDDVELIITDDGPGFAAEIIDRIGEPYLTRQRSKRQNVDDEGTPPSGLGLGLFIAKTLLERSGASLQFTNHRPQRGAMVRLTWERRGFEGEAPVHPDPAERETA